MIVIAKMDSKMCISLQLWTLLLCFVRPTWMAGQPGVEGTSGSRNLYSHVTTDIYGNRIALERYRGKASLIVNVASECGFTDSHYQQLVKAQKTLGENFVVLAFPCNQFKNQEPKTNDEIMKFVKDKYKVNFPMFAKTNVIKEEVPDLWRQIAAVTGHPPEWNFWKYLVDHNGKIIGYWGPWSDIDEIYSELKAAVDAATNNQAPDVQGPNRPSRNSEENARHGPRMQGNVVGPPPSDNGQKQKDKREEKRKEKRQEL